MTAWPRHSATKIAAPKITALVSDVDGSLVTDDKKLTPEAKNAVARLRDNGIAFSLISSRPPRGLRKLIETLEISAPVAGFNGGALTSPDLTPIAEHFIPPQTAREALDLLDARRVEVWIFSGSDWLVRDLDGAYIGHEQRTVEFPPIRVENFEPALATSSKIVGVSADFELLSQCENELGAALATQAAVSRSQAYYLDVTHPLANKGDALSQIAKLLGAPLEEIAVIGDGANDVTMFERSGLSIAMGNAAPEVRSRADFVTASNRDNGFAKAVERLILNRAGADAKPGAIRAGERP
ncbi:HAD family hydrolase [Rhodoblastus sp.]|uniref:HAD family hydrolase n=1 Tax=Rhodoblastus sp. TaxID=1962975 RepID=UPI003F95BC26